MTNYRQLTEQQESPEVFHVWTCMSIAAASLGGRVYIDFGRSRYKVYPNTFVVLIAGSGYCRKSIALSIGKLVLDNTENPPPMFAQKLTPEAFIKFLHENDSQGLIYASEFTTFLGNDAVGSGMLSIMCDLYDSPRKWSYTTRSRGDEIVENCVINMLAATTPEALRSRLSRDAITSGFSSRVIFVYGDSPKSKDPLPYEQEKERIAAKKIVKRLNAMQKLEGPFHLSDGAKEVYSSWYNDLEEPHAHELVGFYGRIHTHVLKSSMILSAMERDDLEIDSTHIQRSIALIDTVKQDMHIALGEIMATPVGADNSSILDLLRRHGKLDFTTLQRKMWRTMNTTDLREVLCTLLQAGVVDEYNKGNKIWYVYKGE